MQTLMVDAAGGQRQFEQPVEVGGDDGPHDTGWAVYTSWFAFVRSPSSASSTREVVGALFTARLGHEVGAEG